jgi:6-pyruvoyl-tetrahydropterin synthase
VLEPFDHQNLNRVETFGNRVPTTENLCMEIERRLRQALPARLSLAVRIEETPNNYFEYREAGRGTSPETGSRARSCGEWDEERMR